RPRSEPPLTTSAGHSLRELVYNDASSGQAKMEIQNWRTHAHKNRRRRGLGVSERHSEAGTTGTRGGWIPPPRPNDSSHRERASCSSRNGTEGDRHHQGSATRAGKG